jgi:hypothetical protein
MDESSSYSAADVIARYRSFWDSPLDLDSWITGPAEELGTEFQVAHCARDPVGQLYNYATVGMSLDLDMPMPLELCLVSPVESWECVEIMAMVAHYHRTASPLGLHHSVNFGRPWLRGSRCDYGYVSLPYLDGPQLEWGPKKSFRVLWLVPITQEERDYKKKFGVEALERLLDRSPYFFSDVSRASLV